MSVKVDLINNLLIRCLYSSIFLIKLQHLNAFVEYAEPHLVFYFNYDYVFNLIKPIYVFHAVVASPLIS